MDLLVWSGLLSFIANLGIGLFVFSRNPEEKTNRLFLLLSLTIAGWSLGSTLANIIPEKTHALAALRCNYLFGIFTPVSYAHLIHSLAPETRINTLKRRAFYVLSLLLCPFVLTPYFIVDLRVIPGTTFRISAPGPLYYVFFIYFSLAMTEVLYQTWVGLRARIGMERHQFKYFAVANLFAMFAGFEYFSRVFGFFKSPPIDDYILVVYVLVLAVGVNRHRLFDVDALIKAFRKERLVTLGLLASSVNHEIKSPLFIVRGLLDKALDEDRAPLTGTETKDLLGKIYRQVDRMSDVISRFNDLLKKSDSKKTGAEETGSVETALNEALEILSMVRAGKKIKISRQVPSDLPLALISQGELEEVFLNLLMNAVDAMPDGGELVISAEKSGKGLKVQIEDNGVGFSKHQLNRLFQPFHSTKGEKGTGLGLYITKQILDRRGARISAKRRSPAGTIFTLEFLTVSD